MWPPSISSPRPGGAHGPEGGGGWSSPRRDQEVSKATATDRFGRWKGEARAEFCLPKSTHKRLSMRILRRISPIVRHHRLSKNIWPSPSIWIRITHRPAGPTLRHTSRAHNLTRVVPRSSAHIPTQRVDHKTEAGCRPAPGSRPRPPSFSGEPFAEVERVDAQLTVRGPRGPPEGFAEFPLQDGRGPGGRRPSMGSTRTDRWTVWWVIALDPPMCLHVRVKARVSCVQASAVTLGPVAQSACAPNWVVQERRPSLAAPLTAACLRHRTFAEGHVAFSERGCVLKWDFH